MKFREEHLAKVQYFLEQPVQNVLLIRVHNASTLGQELKKSLDNKKVAWPVINFDQILAVEAVLQSIATGQNVIFIFNIFEKNNALENIYVKYQLDQWKAKVIFICENSLLHLTLDPSIYFAPCKGSRIQRHLLCTLKIENDEVLAKQLSVAAAKPSVALQAEKCRDNDQHFLNKKLLTKDSVMMRMCADRVLQDEHYKAFLFSLIYASRHNQQMQIAAANAITILNYARVPLSNLDLSGVRLFDADLSWAIAHRTNFSFAKLNRTNMYHAFVDQADFRQADMEECYLEDEERGEFIADYHAAKLSPKGGYLCLQQGSDKVNCFDFLTRKQLFTFSGKLTDSYSYNKGIIFSPDEKQAAYFFENFLADKGVKWIDCETWQQIKGFDDSITRVVFSPDNQYVFFYKDNNSSESIVHWYDRAEKKLLAQLKFEKGISYINFSPDCRHVIFWCGSAYDHTFWYDTTTRQKLTTIDDKVMDIYFSPNSKQVVFCGYYGRTNEAHWYRCDTQKVIKNIDYEQSLRAKFTPDSKHLIVYAERGGAAFWYDCQTTTLLRTLENVVKIVFSPDSRHVIFCCGDEALWYDLATKTLVEKLPGYFNKAVFFDAAQHLIIYRKNKLGPAYLYQCRRVLLEKIATYDEVSRVTISSDERQIALWGGNKSFIIDIDTLKTQTLDIVMTNAIYNKAQQLIFTQSDCCYLLNRNAEHLLLQRFAAYIKAIIADPNQLAFLCVLEGSKAYWCWELAAAGVKPLQNNITITTGHMTHINYANLLPGGFLVSLSAEANIWCVSDNRLQLLSYVKNISNSYIAVDNSHVIFAGDTYYSSHSCYLYTFKTGLLEQLDDNLKQQVFWFLSKDKQLSYFDKKTFANVRALYQKIDRHTDPIDQIVFSPNKQYIVFYNDNTEGTPCAAYMYDFVSGKLLLKETHNSVDILFTSDNKQVFFYFYNPWQWRRVYWYDIATMQLLTIDDGIRYVVLSPNEEHVIFYNNNVVCVAYCYEVKTRQLIFKTQLKVHKAWFSPDGRHAFFSQREEEAKSLIWLDIKNPDAPTQIDCELEESFFFDNNQQVIFYEGSSKERAYWYHVMTKQCFAKLDFEFSKIAISPDYKHIILYGAFLTGAGYWYDIANHQLIQQTSHEVGNVVFSRDSRQLMLFSGENLSWYDVETKQLVLKLEKSNVYIRDVVFLSNNQEFILVATISYMIQIATQKVLLKFPGIGNELFITPDKRYVVFYKEGFSCHDMASRKQLIHIENEKISTVEFVKEKYLILRGDAIHVFDLVTHQYGKINYVSEFAFFLENPSLGNTATLSLITTGKDDRTVRLWDLSVVERPLLKWCSSGMAFSAKNVKGYSKAKNLSATNYRFFKDQTPADNIELEKQSELSVVNQPRMGVSAIEKGDNEQSEDRWCRII